MTQERETPGSDALERLRRGREIVAPSSMWNRIEEEARRDGLPIAWPLRLAAVAAGALLWIAASRVVIPCGDEGVPAWAEVVDAAAPFLVRGSLEERRPDALSQRPELLLIRTLTTAPEESR